MTAAKKAASAKAKAADEADDAPVFKSSGYTVVAPRIEARFGNQVLQFAAGDILPSGANEDSLQHLIDLGFIAESE